MNIEQIKSACDFLDIYPNKKMGQNFLINEKVATEIIQAGNLTKQDIVLEIGPGLGVLTWSLVEKTKQVIALEKDKRLCAYLDEQNKILNINHKQQTQFLNMDALEFISLNITSPYKLISNLPYQITSPVLWKFLRYEKNKPELMVLMVQKEVGERILATTGKMNILAVLCQFYASVEQVCVVPKNDFWPAPQIDSMVIKLVLKKQITDQQNNIDENVFFRLVKIGFSAKRKMLKNNLSAGLQKPMTEIVEVLNKIGLNEKIRAQELGVWDWERLTKLL